MVRWQRRGLTPGYEQKTFSAADKEGRLRLVASPDGREGSITIHTDALLYAGIFAADPKLQDLVKRIQETQ